jgi:hypothetical protein
MSEMNMQKLIAVGAALLAAAVGCGIIAYAPWRRRFHCRHGERGRGRLVGDDGSWQRIARGKWRWAAPVALRAGAGEISGHARTQWLSCCGYACGTSVPHVGKVCILQGREMTHD